MVVRIRQLERLRVADAQADDLGVESRRVAVGAELDGRPLSTAPRTGGPGRRRRPRAAARSTVAMSPASSGRSVTGTIRLAPEPELLERALLGVRRPASPGGAAGSARRSPLPRRWTASPRTARVERQRLALVDGDLLDVRGVDRAQPMISCNAVSTAAGTMIARRVVQDVFPEPLPHDVQRHLARPKARGTRARPRWRRVSLSMAASTFAAGISTSRRRRVSLSSVIPAFMRSIRSQWCERGDLNPHGLPATGS